MALGFASILAEGATEIARGVVVVGYDDSAVTTGLARTQGKMAGTGGVLKKLAIGFGIVGIAATKLGMDFEDSMDKIHALVGVSEEQIKSWSKSILKLAPEVGKSPKELAEALYFISSAGFRGGAAIDILTQSAKASSAGLGETKTVADIVTSALNAYGVANLSATKATDILIQTVTQGKMPPEDLARALGRVLPLASKMGISFDQVGGAIASMSRQGINARFSVFGLMALIQTFAKPTKSTKATLDAMGMSIDGVRKSIKEKGLFATLMDMKAAIGDNIDMWGKLIPNTRAENAALIITGKSAKQNGEIFDKLAHSSGSLAKAWGIVKKDASFQLHQALEGLITALTRLGILILPTVMTIVRVFGALFRLLNRYPAVMRALATAIKLTVLAWIAYKVAGLAAVAVTKLQALWVGRARIAQRLLRLELLATRGAAVASAATVVAGANAESAAIGRAATQAQLLRMRLLSIAGRVFTAFIVVHEIIKHLIPGHKDMGWDFSEPTAKDVVEKGNPYIKGSTNYGEYAQGSRGKPPELNAAGKPMYGHTSAYLKGVQHAYHMGWISEKRAKQLGLKVTAAMRKNRQKNMAGGANQISKAERDALLNDGKGGKDEPPEMPERLQMEEARARLTKTTRDDLASLEHQATWLRQQINKKGQKRKVVIALTNQLADVLSSIDSIHERAKKKKHKKDKDKQDPNELPAKIEEAKARARLTKGLADDLRALNMEERFLLKRIAANKGHSKILAKLYGELADVREEKKRIKDKDAKDEADTVHSERMAYIQERANLFFGEFADNVYSRDSAGKLHFGSNGGKGGGGGSSKTVNVTQNITQPVTGMTSLRMARFAAEATL